MSIIYDALQKVQQEQEIKPNPPVQLKRKRFNVKLLLASCLILLVVVLSAFAVYQLAIHFNDVTKFLHIAKKPTHTHQGNLQLTGVFVASDKKLAMINNRLLTVGDKIDGLSIVNIYGEGVYLQDNEHSVSLRLNG